jgi:3-oxoadipate enol-lactonase
VDLPLERRQILVESRLMSYLAAGAAGPGRLVVFLHAFPLNAGMWLPQLRALPRGWAGVAPDFRGFGESEPDGRWGGPRAASRMEDYASDVAALLDALGASRAVLCGCSIGGYAALAVLRAFPQRVAALLLASTRATADTDAARAGRAAMLETLDRQGPAAIAADMRAKLVGPTSRGQRPEVAAAMDDLMRSATSDGIGHAVCRMLSRPDTTAELAGFHGPVTVVAGEEDTLAPPEEAASMAAAARGATLARIPSAGHLPNLEAPEPFNAALRALLASCEKLAA